MAEKQNRTQKQNEREIRQLKKIFSTVQLLEADEIGSPARGGARGCRGLWGGSALCANCVARKAMEEHTRCSKLEAYGNSLYEVTAAWVQVDGRDCVLEMSQKLDPEAARALTGFVDGQEYRDMLTGMYNRQYYEEKIQTEKLTAGVALIALDDAGFANDVYGRYAGEALLETAATVIRRSIAASDQLIRYSEDELLLLQPDIKQERFAQKLEQLRLQLYAAEVPGYARLQLSVSIGGVWVQDTEADSAVRRAERLVQYAKPQKNTVITSEAAGTGDWLDCRQSVLIVDDSAMNRRLLSEILGSQFDTAEASSGEECLRLLEQNRTGISIVLLDVHMKGIDGFTVLEAMNQQNMLDEIPVIMISSEGTVDSVRRAYDLGASDYISRPFDARVVYQRVTNTIRLYAKQRRLSAMVADQVHETEKNSQLMISLLTQVMEKRNGESRDHVRRVQITTAMLLTHLAQKNEQYQLSRAARRRITMAAALHDVGKMELEDRLLNRKELTREEWAELQQHTVLGAKLLELADPDREEAFVHTAAEICRWHHERYDGSGYPDGLVGEQIPLAAQVVGLADAYEGLVSGENGQQPYPHQAALYLLCNTMSEKFSPLLLQCLQEIGNALAAALAAPDEQDLW